MQTICFMVFKVYGGGRIEMGSAAERYAFVYRFQLSLCNVNILSSMSLEEEGISQFLRLLSAFTKTRIYQALYLNTYNTSLPRVSLLRLDAGVEQVSPISTEYARPCLLPTGEAIPFLRSG